MFGVKMDHAQRHNHLMPNSASLENSNTTRFDNHHTNTALCTDLYNQHHDHHHLHHQQQLFTGPNHHGDFSGHLSSSSMMNMDSRFMEHSGIPYKGKDTLGVPNDVGINPHPPGQMHGSFPQTESSMRDVDAPALVTPLGHHHNHYHHHAYGQLHHGHHINPIWGQYRVNPPIDIIHSTWCYPAVPCFPGGNLNPSSRDMGGAVGQDGRFHSIPFYNQYQQLVPGMMRNPSGHHLGALTAHMIPVNSILHFPIGSSSRNYRPNRRPTHSTPSHLRISSSEEFNDVDFLSFYGAENYIDRHSDLRLDIDGMSYEELLELGEKIGEVRTGLSREAITNKLKTRAWSTPAHHLAEAGACIICQAEYAEKERIGTLDCGHEYHADCITEWLLVKNICPVCKTTAVPAV